MCTLCGIIANNLFFFCLLLTMITALLLLARQQRDSSRRSAENDSDRQIQATALRVITVRVRIPLALWGSRLRGRR